MLLGMPPVPGVHVLGIFCGRQVTRVSGADLRGACQPGEPGELRPRVLPGAAVPAPTASPRRCRLCGRRSHQQRLNTAAHSADTGRVSHVIAVSQKAGTHRKYMIFSAACRSQGTNAIFTISFAATELLH